MKSGFVGGLLTGFTLAILGGGWFVAAHKVVDTAQNPKGTGAPYTVQVVVERSPDPTKLAGVEITSFRFKDTP